MTEFYLHKDDGVIANKATIKKAIDQLTDGTYLVKIESAKKRSSPQNRYFHGPMLDIVFHGLRDAGFNEVKTKDDAKVVVKSLFLKRHFSNEETGEVIDYIKDTHNLTKEEMNILIEDVIQWTATFLNCQIPYPGEKLMLEF